MNLVKKFFIILFSLVTVFTLYKYKTVPSGKLWNSYTVVYIPVSVDDSVVLDGFLENGIEEYICLSKQRVPVMFKLNSVEKAMYSVALSPSDQEYLRRRENFFFDSAKQYRLYYVPNQYKENTNSFIKEINKHGIEGGIDSTFAYPFILPLITLLFCALLVYLSKSKILIALASLFSILFVMCNPFYVCAIAACLLTVLIFIITNIWKREGAFKKLFHSLDFFFFGLLSLFLPFTNSVYSGIFFLMICLSIFGILYITHLKEKEILQKQTYTFVLIRTARQTSLYAGKTKPVLLVITAAVICIFASFVLNSTQSFSGHFARVLLPGESTITSKELVNLDDYYGWTWKIKSLPYQSLNTKNNTSSVVYPEYKKENGRIVKTEQTMSYNQAFKDSVYDDIENLDFYSIEQVLKSQGKESTYGFTASSSYNVTIISIILMIITLIMLIFLDISVIIKKGGKK